MTDYATGVCVYSPVDVSAEQTCSCLDTAIRDTLTMYSQVRAKVPSCH